MARLKLFSEKGTTLRKHHCADVEAVFGLIKGNGGFKRFLLRGLEKVNVEWGIISIAHNLKRLSEVISSLGKSNKIFLKIKRVTQVEKLLVGHPHSHENLVIFSLSKDIGIF
ncbi:transposase [uncultured Ilyobacter sp.]|uniref:transposase n=1 Tax=uncultured Ilyobacter sp. TaxID=544433 RepID=UPI003749FDC2